MLKFNIQRRQTKTNTFNKLNKSITSDQLIHSIRLSITRPRNTCLSSVQNGINVCNNYQVERRWDKVTGQLIQCLLLSDAITNIAIEMI